MVVRLVCDHLWGHILESATKSVPLFLFKRVRPIRISSSFNTPSEIANLKNIVLGNQQVFGFQIAMNESMFVQKVNASNALNKKIKCFCFTELPLFSYDKEEIALCDVLKD